MSPIRRLARFVSTAALALVTGNAVGQTSDCAVHQGNTRSLLPQHSSNPSYLATSNDAQYLYGLTQFGWVRAPLTDPMNPSPLSLGQHGLKFANGGVVPMICDCWQMGTTMAFAESSTGSARVFFDNNSASQGGGLAGQVGKADGAGLAMFGQQIDIQNYTIGVGVGAIHLPASGKFIGYIPSDSGVQVIDATTVTGDPSASAALRPVGSLNWAGFVRLQAAHVQVPSLAYDKYLLVGGLTLSRQIRVAEIDPSTGIPVQKASLASIGEPSTLDVATVGNRIFIFSAEGTAGLNIYEYTPSQFGGTLTHARNIPGSVNPAVVRGGQFPAIFMHRDATPFQSFVDVYDTKFLTQGGQPRKAYSLPHLGAPQEAGVAPRFLGRAVDAKVVTNGPVVTAYVYRLVQKRTGEAEDSFRTDKLDISCISADLTTPPAASASLVNLSAQARSGVEATRNYFGDRWHIRDTSSTGAPLDQIEWDFNIVSGQFAPNESTVLLPGQVSEVNPAYFPCDPSSNGNIRTGANCHLSLGSPASGSFSIGNRTKNVNGWSANTFISAGQNVIAPQAIVAGYDGANLRVLSGGQASASGSQGNLTDATAAWVFNPGGVALSGFSVAVPSGATSFSMDVIYRGGYVSRVSGGVQQVDLVPDFTLTSPVVRSNPITLTNRMQIGPAATLNSVEYAVDQSSGNPASYTATLPGSFLPINGTATINAPATVGSYYVHLRYNYTAGIARNVTVTKPLSVINQLVLTVTGPATANTGQQVTFTVNGGGPSTTYAWNWGDCPFCNPPYVAGPATNTHVYTNPGPFIVTVRASDPSAPDAFPTATIDIIGPPPPPPPTPPPPPPPTPPPSGFSVALTGPASGSAGSPITFSATASGGTGTVSYAWRWGDNALSLNFLPGPATNSYTYAAPGQFTVTVRATDGVGSQAEGSASVAIAVPSGPPLNLSVSGPPRGRKDQAIPFTTSVSGGVPPYTYAWRWGDSAFGVFVNGPANHSHAYGSLGQFSVSVRATDSVGQGVTATTTVTIDASFQALIVPGAAWLNLGSDVWATDISVANPGAESLSLAVAFLPYLTDSPGSVDLSTLTYRAIDTPLAPNGGSWSQTNIVQWLGGRDTDKGTLVLRYEGPVPVVNGRVYFARGSNPLGPAYGAPVEAFKADQGGRVLVPASAAPRGVEAGGEQTLIGLRSTDLYRFGVTLYNSSGVETRAELRAFDETGTTVEITTDDAGTRGTVREVRIRPYQQVYLRNQDLGVAQHPNKRYVFRANKIGADGSLVAFGAAIDTKTSDLEQFTDDTPPAVSDEQGSVYLYIPGASRFDSGTGAKWRTELRAYNPANVERTLTVDYLYSGAGEPESTASATVRVGPGKLVAADDVIGSVMDDFTPHDLKTLSTVGLLRIRYSPEVPGAPMVLSARNYDDQVAGTAGTQLSVYSRREGVSIGEPPLYVPGAQEDTGENVRLRTTLGVFAMDNRQTRVRLSVVKADGTVPDNGTYEFVLNQPGASSHMSQIFMDRNVIGGIVNNEPMTIKTEVLEGGRAGVYVVTVDTNTRDTSFKPGRPVH